MAKTKLSINYPVQVFIEKELPAACIIINEIVYFGLKLCTNYNTAL